MSSTPAERRALAVVAAIAALGVVARFVKSRHARPAPTAAEMLALDAQISRVRAARAGSKGSAGPARSRSRARIADSSRLTRPASQPTRDSTPPALVDLDTAGLVTIERLPWIGPS